MCVSSSENGAELCRRRIVVAPYGNIIPRVVLLREVVSRLGICDRLVSRQSWVYLPRIIRTWAWNHQRATHDDKMQITLQSALKSRQAYDDSKYFLEELSVNVRFKVTQTGQLWAEVALKQGQHAEKFLLSKKNPARILVHTEVNPTASSLSLSSSLLLSLFLSSLSLSSLWFIPLYSLSRVL